MDVIEQQRLNNMLKICENILDIIKDDIELNDKINEKRNLASIDMMKNHVSWEYGIKIQPELYNSKYQILDNIVYLYKKRRQKIKDYDLQPLESAMYQLDFNKKENQKHIIDFIKYKYDIVVDDNIISPLKTKHEIVDYIMDLL